jgi:tetratricopeptide (TPR) repeat protein
VTQAPFNVLFDQARRALKQGQDAQAATLFFQAASKTTTREHEYVEMLAGFRHVAVRAERWRTALSIDWYRGDTKAQAEVLNHVPVVEQARTLQSWGENAQSQKHDARAAKLYTECGLFAHAAACHERCGNHREALPLWSRLAHSLRQADSELYMAGLAAFNVARSCLSLDDERGARDAVIASVHALEEAADRYEQIGLREKAFDCYQVLIAIGEKSGTFEHALEGYVNAIRILSQDQLRHYAIESFEDCIAIAAKRGEHAAAATLAQQLADYAAKQGVPQVAAHGRQLKAQMWERAAEAHLERGAPAELVENALLAAVVTRARLGQFARVGSLYRALGKLDLEATRIAHYERVAPRYQSSQDRPVDAAPLAAHLRLGAEFPDVWLVDLIEWEQAGSASAACADVILDRASWSEITRRRALLARLAALDLETAGASADEGTLMRLITALGELGLYCILSPLERLFEHPRPNVRRAVIEAMARFLFKRTFITMRRALDDDDDTVAQQARKSIEALRFPHAFDPLARIYREATDSHVRVSVLQAVARIDTPEAAEWLLGVLEHEGKAERDAVVAVLARVRGHQFVQIARREAASLSAHAREAVQTVFSNRGERL